MKSLCLTLLVLIASLLNSSLSAHGQVTAYYPDDNMTNVATPGGWYPLFTNVTGIRYQMLIPASAFSAVPIGGTMVSLGFFVGTTNTGGPATYSILQYRLGPAASQTLTNTFATNLVPTTETLVFDAPNSSFPPNPTSGAWMDFPFITPYIYAGTDLILDVQSQIPSGGGYFRQAVSSSVPRLINTAYTGQPTGTLVSSSGVKVRFTFISSTGPAYQTNQSGASFDVDGVLGNFFMPALPTLAINQAGTLNFTSINTGWPWDLALGSAPLVTPSTGGLVLSDGQIINLDVADPGFSFLFNFLQGPGFANMALPFSSPAPLMISAQMIVIDPFSSIGISLSQPVRLTVQ